MDGTINRTQLFIGGQWVTPQGDAKIEVTSPYSEKVIGSVPRATAAEIDQAVAAARAAFDGGPWPRMSMAERLAVVGKIRDGLQARAQEIVALIATEMGSPVKFGMKGQIGAAIGSIGATMAVAQNFPVQEYRSGTSGPVLIRKIPVGVVAAITPWNVPLFLTCAKTAGALLAGCTVVHKPASATPLDAFILAEICAEAGLPEGVFSTLPIAGSDADQLVGHPDVDKVTFTGSVEVGSHVWQVAGTNVTRTTLELGGKSAGIILDDADLDVAIPTLVGAGMPSNGEICVSLTRVLVPRSRYAEIAERYVACVQQLKVGDPLDPATDIGPLVNKAQQDRVLGYIELGLSEGATLLTGGKIPADQPTGYFVEPTVLGDVDNSWRVAQEEIFGPVVCLIPYDTVQDAIELANASDMGLSGAVWAGDAERGIEVAKQVRTGQVSVNSQSFDLLAPFGGFKHSGIGREFGPEGYSAFHEYQTINLPQGYEAPAN